MNDLRRKVATMLRLPGRSLALAATRARPVARMRNVPYLGSIMLVGTFSWQSSVPAALVSWIASSSVVYWALEPWMVCQRRGSAPVPFHSRLTAFNVGDGTLAQCV